MLFNLPPPEMIYSEEEDNARQYPERYSLFTTEHSPIVRICKVTGRIINIFHLIVLADVPG